MKKQVFNPFLPLREYIPDGEPHVFGDRVYLFGSHDKECGESYCMLDYVVWSAPVNDLTDWSNTGTTYMAKQDPLYSEPDRCDMYAPDVVCGNDGKYYLYYCLAGFRGKGGYSNPISVAVSDKPDGKYEYLGVVKNPDGTPFMKYVNFDPAVINDDGVIRLYSGTWYDFDDRRDDTNNKKINSDSASLFGRTPEEMNKLYEKGDSPEGPIHLVLSDDMMTIKGDAVHVLPFKHKNTDYENHGFFEASSIRKIDGIYYFIYSSVLNHELCYMTSEYPDRDFSFKGTLVSNGDVFVNNNYKRLNTTGNTHGSVEDINGQWYVFYHRGTHGDDFSRQALCEKISFENGIFTQAEMTSCGLNNGPLRGYGTYPAAICCHLYLLDKDMPHGDSDKENIPMIDTDEDIFVRFKNMTRADYKYYDFDDLSKIKLKARGKGEMQVILDSITVGCISINANTWSNYSIEINSFKSHKSTLSFVFKGSNCELLEFTLE